MVELAVPEGAGLETQLELQRHHSGTAERSVFQERTWRANVHFSNCGSLPV
jgi:hypothetical protein